MRFFPPPELLRLSFGETAQYNAPKATVLSRPALRIRCDKHLVTIIQLSLNGELDPGVALPSKSTVSARQNAAPAVADDSNTYTAQIGNNPVNECRNS